MLAERERQKHRVEIHLDLSSSQQSVGPILWLQSTRSSDMGEEATIPMVTDFEDDAGLTRPAFISLLLS